MNQTQPTRTRSRRRRRVLLWAVAVAGVFTVFAGGWVAASLFESPAQRAARAEAPSPSAVTARVTHGDLSRTVTAGAVVGRSVQQIIPLASDTSPGVVTGQPLQAGSLIAAGSVIAEVNGRPVIALPGSFRFYRDLTLGDSGPDVAQLQRGLSAAGFATGDDGKFGQTTARSLRALYEHVSYRPVMKSASPADGKAGDTADKGATVQPTTPAQPTSVEQIVASRFELATLQLMPSYLVSAPPVNADVDDKTQLVVDQGTMTATAQIADSVASSLETGMKGTLTASASGSIPVSIATIGVADKPGAQIPVTLAADSAEIPTDWLGKQVLASITIQSAATDSLLVPTAALVTTGGKNARVLKQEADGSFREIDVTEVAQLSGRSAITLVNQKDKLTDGDLVKVK